MEKRRIAVGSDGITFLDAGGEDNPILLCIHGNLGSRIWFRDVTDVPGYRVLAPDMPNFSDSTTSGDYSMTGYARRLEDFLRALDAGPGGGLPGVVLLGHSLGGVVAMEMAARALDAAGAGAGGSAAGRPEIAGHPLEGMLLVSPGPIEGLVTPRERYPVIESFRNDRRLLTSALGAMVPALDDPGRLEELVDEALRMDPGAFIGHADALAGADFRERLGRLPFPTMILRGDGDILITRDMALRTADHLGALYRELPGIGHSPMVENPRLFLTVLKDFLE